MKILIKNGIIINADSSQKADVLCIDGKIVEIGKNIKPNSAPEKTIDADGCYIFPGGIDPHVHMHFTIAGRLLL